MSFMKKVKILEVEKEVLKNDMISRFACCKYSINKEILRLL